VKKPPKTAARQGFVAGVVAAQPGNRPGRGKAAHPRKPPAKKPPPQRAGFVRTVQAGAKKAKKHPRRQLALGEGVACCSAQALAASLRLAGVPVSDDDVLALYWRTASDADAGASILATLEAASRFGLARVRPAEVHELNMPCRATQDHLQLRAFHGGEFQRLDDVRVALLDGDAPDGAVPFKRDGGDVGRGDAAGILVHGLILGISDPAPHAVLATADGWHSWGGLYEPWTDDIDEAWEVTW
jgi:hypothetical protein